MITDTGIRTRDKVESFHTDARLRGLVALGINPLNATKIASKARNSGMSNEQIHARYNDALRHGVDDSVASTFCVSSTDLTRLIDNYNTAIREHFPVERADEFVYHCGDSFERYIRQYKQLVVKCHYSKRDAANKVFESLRTIKLIKRTL